jgi:hypothetical protein
MNINYWDCEYGDADELPDGEGGLMWSYHCDHPNGTGFCQLENKWGGDCDYCVLLSPMFVG